MELGSTSPKPEFVIPVNTMKGRAKSSYYAPKQTLESVFERLAATVEACRIILISKYLIDTSSVLDVSG
ncbi:hypothetical protein ASPSYDRAFT_453335 [Aspergillus sydowii CBS 593.65]|uniref:Uncharacterized protein n=1 Tax=Aspergillus sydowii CBS 593.65 TaxID=1036612 RepID=A0A1L9T709_9EURO|nr:uncharacterized protein ASPSYDRAFT_453335 [Aspergillus sydowii CBS 593.65]OJJ55229.1 hypothetical protein ASPSYDRAFT_453335 [Aspergillus sydowii CBS 593.65]